MKCIKQGSNLTEFGLYNFQLNLKLLTNSYHIHVIEGMRESEVRVMTFEQQMWDKWADDDDERAWLIPEYRKESGYGEDKQKSNDEKTTV